jgi:DNA-binding HxlR family transcriptional regulator
LIDLLPDISTKVLTRQLAELETDNIITRQSFKESPPRVEYSLSDYGRTVVPVLHAIKGWGLKHLRHNPKILHKDSEWRKRIQNAR